MTEFQKLAAALLLLSPILLYELSGPASAEWAAAGKRAKDAGQPAGTPTGDLGGGWQAFLPAGFEQRVQLVPLENSQYELRPKSLTFSGIYQRTGDTFHMIESNDGSPAGFIWKVRSPHLMTLVDQTSLVGSNYESAVLFRSADKKGK